MRCFKSKNKYEIEISNSEIKSFQPILLQLPIQSTPPLAQILCKGQSQEDL